MADTGALAVGTGTFDKEFASPLTAKKVLLVVMK